MNVASLELSKKLYEISEHTWLGDGDHKPEYKAAPIYTLGYLLRKLQGYDVDIYYSNQWQEWVCNAHDPKYTQRADTPEDAAVKLCIELFQQSILQRSTHAKENNR